MIERYMYLIGFILIVFIAVLCNLANKISLRSSRSKKVYLRVNSIIDLGKDSYILLLRACVYLIFIGISTVLAYIIFKLDGNIISLHSESTLGQSFALLVMAVIVSIKMFFLCTTIVISVIKKKNVQYYISDMKWIESNENFRVYTKIIRPIIIGFIEGIIFCVVFNRIGTKLLGMNFLLTTFILSIYYGIGKTLLMKDINKKIIILLYGFWYCFIGTLLYGATGNFISSIILFILGTSFWVFKR